MRKPLAIKLKFFSTHFLLAVFLIGVVDNQSWSDGNVCDGLTQTAKGLCNAYCNGMKCGTDQQNVSDTACDKVLNNYLEISEGAPPTLQPLYIVARLPM